MSEHKIPENTNSESRPRTYSLQEFDLILKSKVKTNPKNRGLRKGLKGHKSPETSANSESLVSTARARLADIKQNLLKTTVRVETDESELVFEKISIIVWFIARPSSVKNMIPDIEYIEFSKNKTSQFKSLSKHEDYYRIGKLFCHEGNFTQASLYFNKAKMSAPKLEKYQVWKSMATIKGIYDLPKEENKTSSYCGGRSSLTKRDYLLKEINKLMTLPQSVEVLWCFMEIACLNVLIVGEEIEPPRFYAAIIKKTSEFYGLLAWTKIYINESNSDSQSLLLELISSFPNRPEPYYMSWLYFYKKKQYDRSKEVAIEAFLKITSSDFEHFYIIFCLCLAKSYYYCGEFLNCVDLLKKKYLEHPTYTVFLYALSKYCVVSDDFAFSGIAKGNLKELLRLSDDSRKGNIYLYLSKSYWLTRQFPQSYKFAYKANQCFLLLKKDRKKSEAEKKITELYPFISRINQIKKKIQTNSITENDNRVLEDIKDFHKPTADLLTAEILYLKNQKNEAVSLLKTMISTSRLETTAYFKLLEYDKLKAESIFKGLLTRAKNSQIPTQVWVKANLQYAKFMFKSSHYNKCFYVLRILARILPPLPFLELPYCVSLQLSDNLQELSTSCSVLVSEESHSKPSYFNIKEIAYRISEDAPLPGSSQNPKKSRIVDGKVVKNFYSMAGEKGIEGSQEEIFFNSDEEAYNFSVCSNPRFLYYIGKFSAKIRRNKAEGLFAIKDFIEMLKIEKNEIKKEKWLRKAKKVESALKDLDV